MHFMPQPNSTPQSPMAKVEIYKINVKVISTGIIICHHLGLAPLSSIKPLIVLQYYKMWVQFTSPHSLDH
jgi:hypothetical protein